MEWLVFLLCIQEVQIQQLPNLTEDFHGFPQPVHVR